MSVSAVESADPAVPAGFEVLERPGLRAWARRGLLEPAIEATEPGTLEPIGRGRVRFLRLGGADPRARFALRHYFRGGILAPLLRDFHLDERRPLREIALMIAAAEAGVPTLEPVAGISRRVAGLLWRCDLVTRAIEGAQDLSELYPELARGSARRRAAVIEAAARAVRALHDAGFEHRDLNLANLLVDLGVKEAPRVLVIDLDGASVHKGPLGEAPRRRNLSRLYRSSQKLARARGGVAPSFADLVRFARGYSGGDERGLRALARLELPALRLRRVIWAATRSS